MKQVRKAVIPAAGRGTRFLPATKVQPKEMLPIVDKPVIQYLVEEAAASGIEEIIIITGQSKRAIEDHFDRTLELEYSLAAAGKHDLLESIKRISELARFVYVRQQVPLGNGHAVLVAKEVVGDEPFAVLWGDDMVVSEVPCLKQMMGVYERYGHSVIAAMRVAPEDKSKYGMIRGTPVEERISRVEELVEKPDGDFPSDLAQVKGFILTPEIFDVLEQTPPKKGGEIWLADAIETLLGRQPVYAYEFEGRRYDAGNVGDYLRAQVDLALARPEFRAGLLAHLRTIPLASQARGAGGGLTSPAQTGGAARRP
ncbi:MAG: UTP--glucose-1-phosphate uridylyltransferase GalU [Chloroflexota bacterium]